MRYWPDSVGKDGVRLLVAVQQRLPSAAGVLQAQALMSPATDIGPYRQPHFPLLASFSVPFPDGRSRELSALRQFCADHIRQNQAEDDGRIQGTEL
ncbi:hypothetical protein [Novosphingobium sp. FKTRR1]|uniref:hypothetical protein n=1 Tax=Novosphingobium sp. FKTRR1 TaxID=2879118 RepID=UPI001CEFF20F|nr:hypothetical protein [Novosphingobium sp. FKTRR1]